MEIKLVWRHWSWRIYLDIVENLKTMKIPEDQPKNPWNLDIADKFPKFRKYPMIPQKPRTTADCQWSISSLETDEPFDHSRFSFIAFIIKNIWPSKYLILYRDVIEIKALIYFIASLVARFS